MPFDANLVLRGIYTTAVIDLESTEEVAISTDVNADGAKCLDLKKTGAKGLAAVMILPTAPTGYDKIMTAIIQESDALKGGWRTIADFPVIYTLLLKVYAVATTAAAIEADVGLELTGAGDANDIGIVVYISPELFEVGGKGYFILARKTVNALFDDVGATVLTTGLTFNGHSRVVGGTAAAITPPQHGPGIYVVRFTTSKRYLRGKYTAEATGNFGKVQVLLANHPFETL